MNIKINDGDCPCSKKLKQIEEILYEFKIHESIDTVSAVDLLASELRMRRAKEIYDIKMKASIIGYAQEYFNEQENEK